jgi:tetratricopeptide (TPR) repeat protein
VNPRGELATLEASGLIQVAALEPELEYLFRHALVQDAAYSSLLKQDRRALHRLAAETLLALYPDRRRELAGVIAMHYEQAGDPAAAVEHLVVAGEAALERFANREAVDFFDRAEASLGPDDPRVELRLRTALGAARIAWSFRGADESIGRLERLLPQAEAHGDLRLLSDVYFWIAFLRRMRGENVATSAELRHAVDRAGEIGATLGDPSAQALPDAFMGVGMLFSGELQEGTETLARALPRLTNADPVSSAILHGLLSIGYSRLGRFSEAAAVLAEAKRIAADGDPIATLDADISESALLVERGDIGAGERLATSCAVRSEELGAMACAVPANVISGAAHLAREDALGAKAPLERGEELSHIAAMGSFQTLAEGMLGTVRARLGDLPGGAVGWATALERARSTHDRYAEAITLWQRAGVTIESDPAAALDDIDGSIALFAEIGARPSVARTMRDRSRILRALGRTADADAAAAEAQGLASELGLSDFGAGGAAE